MQASSGGLEDENAVVIAIRETAPLTWHQCLMGLTEAERGLMDDDLARINFDVEAKANFRREQRRQMEEDAAAIKCPTNEDLNQWNHTVIDDVCYLISPPNVWNLLTRTEGRIFCQSRVSSLLVHHSIINLLQLD